MIHTLPGIDLKFESHKILRSDRTFLRYVLLKLMTGLIFFLQACSSETVETEETLFELTPADHTNVTFENRLAFDPDFNIYRYRNFYNGGGVAAGDISGNGLPDLFFVGNMVPNRLYLNKGKFEFEDITESAGVTGTMTWATGVSLVDINGNGLLDIYVTNSGEVPEDERKNELFINNGDLTFTESAAEFGIDDPGYGIHAVFFDFNSNGLLDMYLLNNSNEPIGNFDISDNQRLVRDPYGGDKLYRNEGGSFTDISEQAGIYGSEIGFSLSATVSDINRNGLPDIYVANDFFERDYLYLNNGNGTFREVLDDQIKSMTAASMGSDIADLTNNGWPDIYVSDMLPDENRREKNMTTYETWEIYRDKVNYGYGHQFTRNALQLNNGDGTFSEVGRLARTEATDWSWAVLLADFDNNGHNDIYVTNGLVQDITNLDYLGEIRHPDMVRSIVTGEGADFRQLIDLIPSEPVGNFLFSGRGDLVFEELSDAWGLGEPGFSSGAAWADLNGNGALDLVVNDVNGPARIYRNRVQELHPDRSWLMVELDGEAPNTQAVGAQLEVWADGQQWYREHMLQRGFQSSVAPGLHIGLGEVSRLDSLRLRWPDGRITRMQDVELPGQLTLRQSEAGPPEPVRPPAPLAPGDISTPRLLEPVADNAGIDWAHREDGYVDFARERLLVHMRSTEGPAMCSGDITGNGLDDLYLGGGRDQPGALYLQQQNGRFVHTEPEAFAGDARSEDTDCALFDATGNGHLDLYVASGGNSFSTGSSALLDRLYYGDGEGGFTRSDQVLPTRAGYVSSSSVAVGDVTGNGVPDLFVGERLRLFSVGMPARGFLLVNDGQGNFEEVSGQWAPEFSRLGMVTDAVWADWTADGSDELIVVGEWMPPRVFRSTGSRLEEMTEELGLDGLTGWWNAIHAADISGNGRPDLVLGNHGLNSRFRAGRDQPVRMWVGDLAGNGITEQILSFPRDGRDYPVALRHELLGELPSLGEKYPDYASYGGQTVQEIFDEGQLGQALELQARELASVIIWNHGDEQPEVEQLPLRAQMSPMYGIWSGDLTGDGRREVLLGGNLYEVKPMAGPYDASYGVVVGRDTDGTLASHAPKQSGFHADGALRGIASLRTINGKTLVVAARNNESPKMFLVND
jgi:enediyne biosynthesis protein E4